MTARKNTTGSSWIDTDDAPELSREWFASADLYHGEKLVRRGGRPKKEITKKEIKLRVDPDVLDAFKATGKGWQTRMHEVLRSHMPKSL